MNRGFTPDHENSVDEGGRMRSFVYDRLGRLTQASNPESGTVNYVYDSNGNLTQRTEARGIVTTIAYDFLNRPLSKAYSGGGTPGAGYSYDKLRLTAVSTGGAVSRAFTYTPGGRIATSTQTSDGASYPFTYAYYYMDGSVASMSYPSGRTVSNPWVDRAGWLTEVTGTLGGVSKSCVSAMTYNEQGLLAATALGNGLTERWSFNAQRQQPYDVRLGTAVNEMSHLTLQFAYCANQYSGGSCTTNNGNILAQWNYANYHIEHYGYL